MNKVKSENTFVYSLLGLLDDEIRRYLSSEGGKSEDSSDWEWQIE